MKSNLLIGIICTASIFGCHTQQSIEKNIALERATATLDSLYTQYAAEGTFLLRENVPFDAQHKVTYLASEEQANQPNQYAYLWPFSGTFSAVNALLETTGDSKYKILLDQRVLSGLENYLDTTRIPHAYSSYIQSAPASDRFYDDNIWLGIDFTDLYQQTKENKYLDKAITIWKFIESGTDSLLEDGIYWCEQKKESKNTCSNAPGSVFALKLFQATADSSYLKRGKALYHWTQKHLQDSTDGLYFDNVRLDGKIGKAKFAYNSGQMMQSAALLYQCTNNPAYLKEAQHLAKECFDYFFTEITDENGGKHKLLKNGNVWFHAVMMRGYIELYRLDHNPIYLQGFKECLDYAWEHARDEKGLFHQDLSGKQQDKKKWLLTQAAMIEMYGRLAAL